MLEYGRLRRLLAHDLRRRSLSWRRDRLGFDDDGGRSNLRHLGFGFVVRLRHLDPHAVLNLIFHFPLLVDMKRWRRCNECNRFGCRQRSGLR